MKGAIIGLVGLLAGTTASAQDPLSAAMDLYASAAYEDALSTLSRLRDSPAAPEVSQQVDRYRAFCLLALGRTKEAESVAETLVTRDPLLQLDANETAPRIEAMFTVVRKRLLPGLIRDAYRTARAATERGDLIGGVQQLTWVRSMLDAAKGLDAWDETLGDINVLVEGFLELSRATAGRRLAAVAPNPESTAPPPVPIVKPQESEGPLRTYSALDTDVTAPVTVRQEMPTVPHGLAASMRTGRKSGVLEITIDETGAVQDAFMREPVNATFDALVLEAARSWQYRPARKSGAPVRYVRRIRVSVGS